MVKSAQRYSEGGIKKNRDPLSVKKNGPLAVPAVMSAMKTPF